jgi:parallel beta-helix repeat protein
MYSCGIYAGKIQNVTVKNTIISNFNRGVETDDPRNITVIGNAISGCGDGVLLYGYNTYYVSSNNTITQNHFIDNDEAVQIYSVSLNAITDNNMSNNEIGIEIKSYIYGNSYGNIASGNRIFGYEEVSSNAVGISLSSTFSNLISDNDVEDGGTGILLSSSNLNNITGNLISGNAWHGIVLTSSVSNLLFDNSITGISLSGSSSNFFYHNAFVSPFTLDNNYNTWDNGYPSGGNYWSDYNGTDLSSGPYQNISGSDGIGDTPYVLNVNNTDHYPLMGSFSSFTLTPNEYVETISNSTISALTFDNSTIHLTVQSPSGNVGFCRICIPTALISAPINVYINGSETAYTLLSCSDVNSSYLYVNYATVAEFPSFEFLPLCMVSALAVLGFCKKKRILLRK